MKNFMILQEDFGRLICRATKAKYALTIVDGQVIEVYEINK